MKALPKISIIVPSYNKAQYIQATLESIFSQRYPNLEVIIQDGGSTDGTLEIIKKYAKKYSKIINWVSKKDKGQVDAINKGFKKATGDILSYINTDDVYEKGALSAVGKYFRNNPSTLWLAGKGKIIDKNGAEISKWVTIYKNILLRLNCYTLLLMVNYLVQPSVFISRKAYKKYGNFIGKKGIILEYDMWLKIGRDKMPRIINDYLSSFRLTLDNFSSTQFKTLLAADLKIMRNHTQNPFLIFLHGINNVGRVFFVKLMK